MLKLVTEARAKGALIIYSVAVPGSVPTDILKDLTPAAGEQVLPPLGPDKFIGSDLEKTLKDKGIKTVIALGTQAQTSVLHTGGGAALREFKVIVPVDGMSADDLFPELYTAWHLANAARISNQVTLTKLDMVGFSPTASSYQLGGRICWVEGFATLDEFGQPSCSASSKAHCWATRTHRSRSRSNSTRTSSSKLSSALFAQTAALSQATALVTNVLCLPVSGKDPKLSFRVIQSDLV